MQDDSDKNAARVWKAASHFSSHLKWVFLWVNNLDNNEMLLYCNHQWIVLKNSLTPESSWLL